MYKESLLIQIKKKNNDKEKRAYIYIIFFNNWFGANVEGEENIVSEYSL